MPRAQPENVTAEAVQAAAAQLISLGRYPSVLAVRRQLGGHGSASTLSRHLRSWREGPGKEALATSLAPDADTMADPEIDALIRLHPRVVQKLQARMTAQAEERIRILDQALQTVRDEADVQAAAAADAVAARMAAQELLQEALAQVARLAEAVNGMQAASEAARREAEMARRADQERILRQERELADLHQQRQRLTEALDREEQASRSHAAETAQVRTALAEAARRIDADLALQSVLREQVEHAQAELAAERHQLMARTAALAAAEAERQTQVAACAQWRQVAEHAGRLQPELARIGAAQVRLRRLLARQRSGAGSRSSS